MWFHGERMQFVDMRLLHRLQAKWVGWVYAVQFVWSEFLAITVCGGYLYSLFKMPEGQMMRALSFAFIYLLIQGNN